jgi:hypothetical protein
MRACLTIMALAVGALVAHAQTGVTRTKRGDTTVVLTEGNGRWGAPHDAIEVLRVPESRQTTFGSAYQLQATADGGVVIADVASLDGMIIRRFDANGKFVHNLGRSGPGPGEYMRQNLTIAVHPRGSVYIRDDDKSVSVYGPDGKLSSTFPLLFNNGSTTEISVRTDASIYVRAPFVPRVSSLPPMLHYSVAGKLLDSVSLTARWLPEGAEGYQRWTMLGDGRILITRTDKVGFLIVGRDGKAPLIGEGPGERVPYHREEREERQAANDLSRDKCGGGRGQQQLRVIVPETKLPARWAAVDIDGRIWILKSATALKAPPIIGASCSGPSGSHKVEITWREPPVYAAFQPDGTYLGEVRFPSGARVTFVGNHAWALVPDADDVLTLVKYRLY